MAITTEGYSLSDIAAATGNNGNCNNGNGWGGDGAWFIILFLIWAFFGFGRNGSGGGYGNGNGINSPAGQGALTRGDLCMDMNFQEVKREIQNANDAVNLGFSNLNSTICNQQYDTARMINGLESTVQGGFNSTNIAMLQGQNAISSQLAQCCCDERQAISETNYNIATQGGQTRQAISDLGYNVANQGCQTRQAISDVNYNIATQGCDTRNTIQNTTRDLIDNQNANARAILDKLTSQEIEAKNAQITALNQQLFSAQLAASQSAQNQYLVNTLRPCPVPAYLTCSPFAASYGIGLSNNGCGCNSGCGCN